jgi:hypothetical protein
MTQSSIGPTCSDRDPFLVQYPRSLPPKVRYQGCSLKREKRQYHFSRQHRAVLVRAVNHVSIQCSCQSLVDL